MISFLHMYTNIYLDSNNAIFVRTDKHNNFQPQFIL